MKTYQFSLSVLATFTTLLSYESHCIIPMDIILIEMRRVDVDTEQMDPKYVYRNHDVNKYNSSF